MFAINSLLEIRLNIPSSEHDIELFMNGGASPFISVICIFIEDDQLELDSLNKIDPKEMIARVFNWTVRYNSGGD